MPFNKSTPFDSRALTECQIHQILANPRRRAVLDYVGGRPRATSVRELSEAIAVAESGQSPAPTKVRDSVYTSLHQTHLPRLQELGIVYYDRERSEVVPLGGSRAVDRYTEVVTRFGVTWAEAYRALGVLGLTVVVAALVEVPVVSLIDPLLWTSGFLAAFAACSAYQLWTDRWRIVNGLRHPHGIAAADGGSDEDAAPDSATNGGTDVGRGAPDGPAAPGTER
jgi:DNA-binding transcriptional ArsR family regulator